MKEGKRYYFERKSRETSKARVRGSARDAAEMSRWRVRFDCTLSPLHVIQVSRKRDWDKARGRAGEKMREACVYHRSFVLENVKTVLRFAVAWR